VSVVLQFAAVHLVHYKLVHDYYKFLQMMDMHVINQITTNPSSEMREAKLAQSSMASDVDSDP